VTTNNDDLAARIRNIRSSYGAGRPVEIPLTGNGRMSEAQAALGLLSLEDYPAIQKRNQSFHRLYSELLGGIPGLKIMSPAASDESNYQYVVIEVGEKFGVDRDALYDILKAENVHSRRYFRPGIHRTVPFCELYPQFVDRLPATDLLSSRVLQLPSGQDVSEDQIQMICDIIKTIHQNAEQIKKRLN
jgi:dTDP-4-amino-4,6-dideoxygalactose transaminase